MQHDSERIETSKLQSIGRRITDPLSFYGDLMKMHCDHVFREQ